MTSEERIRGLRLIYQLCGVVLVVDVVVMIAIVVAYTAAYLLGWGCLLFFCRKDPLP